MIKYLLLIIGVFGTVFIEHFFLKVFSFSVFAVLSIYMWNRWKGVSYIVFFLILGVILDVTMHTALGLHVLSLSGAIVIVWLINIVVPFDNATQESGILFVSTFVYYVVFLVLNSLFVDLTFPEITVTILLGVLLKSLVSAIIYFLLSASMQSVRSKDFEKIRLR